MAYRPGERTEQMRQKLLHSAATLFLEKGYSNTTVRQIAERAGTTTGTMARIFGAKENILAELVEYVLKEQFKSATQMLAGVTDDQILFYAAETTLQLYIVESNENIRDLYCAAYSMPATTAIIQDTITKKLEGIFKEHLPELESKDFYEREIASGGIMRGFMTIPCDRYFTMERKVAAFLQTTFLVYEVPKEKIQEAIEFVSRFDYPAIVKSTIGTMLANLTNAEL